MRYVLLDRITALSPPERALAIKCVSLSDDLFADHFPGLPVMPGALILESLAQLGGVLLEASMREQGRPDLYAVLSIVEKAKFRRMVRPGDKIELEALGASVREEGGRVQAFARVDGALVAEAWLTFSLVPLTNPRVIAQRRELLEVWLAGGLGEASIPVGGETGGG